MSTGSMLRNSWNAALRVHGYDVTFRREVQATYDASTGTVASPDDDETVKGFFTSYTFDAMGDSRIERGSRVFIMEARQSNKQALTKTPQTGDKIVGADDTVGIGRVRKIRSGSTVIGYICEVME